jgi:RNA polymerase sigma-70 factor (ECF subfamily)
LVDISYFWIKFLKPNKQFKLLFLEPENLIQSGQETERLLQTISSLQESQREAALLHLEMGFTVAEIAEITQVNPETAKSRLRYALKKIRQQVLHER